MPKKELIYLDHAGTTPLSPGVLEAMLPYFTEAFGNPSAIYDLGQRARQAMEEARHTVARCIGAQANEIYFTGSGTESDNWAIKGAAALGAARGKTKVITASIEHHGVLNACESLKKTGTQVKHLPVDDTGLVAPAELARQLSADTALVSVMMANNEVGTIEPVGALAQLCREAGVLFHTDAVQAVGHLPIDMAALPADLLSMSAHKCGGPKGVGALFIRSGVPLPKWMDGGAQERGKRGGTENVAQIVGFAKALSIACEEMEAERVRLTALRDRLTAGLLALGGCVFNGHRTARLPGHVNVSFSGVSGEGLLVLLNLQGVCASGGAACASGDSKPSHVLQAMGRPLAAGAVRFTLGKTSRAADVEALLALLPKLLKRLRGMSAGS